MVRTPTRPKYIYSMINHCAGMLKLAVAPAVTPTVASAETASKRLSVNEIGDVALMKMPPNTARMIIMPAMVMASIT